jgi:hypothetical protein
MSSRPIDEEVAVHPCGNTSPGAVEGTPAAFCGRGSPFELERMLTLDEVAEFRGLSKDGIRRHYAHLIRRLSPRRVGMKLRDALTIGNPL